VLFGQKLARAVGSVVCRIDANRKRGNIVAHLIEGSSYLLSGDRTGVLAVAV
jgi:hypothetical protein